MPILLPVFAGTYYLSGGNFNINTPYRKYSPAEMAELGLATKDIYKMDKNNGVLDDIKAPQTTDQAYLSGENKVWKNYRQKFSEILEQAIKNRLFADNSEVNSYYENLESQSEPVYDENGDLMLKVHNQGKKHIQH